MNTFLLLACTLFIPISAADQPAQLDAVIAALSKGDAIAVSAFFDNTVEMVLPGVDDILPKAEARKNLVAFFEAHPVKSFARVHGGTSTGEDGAYVIGTLTTENATFRVYVYGRGSSTPIVQELRIETN